MISSRKAQTLARGDAFGNIVAFGVNPASGIILNAALPSTLYASATARAAGTSPLIPFKDPEIAVMRAKVSELERQLAARANGIEEQIGQLRQDLGLHRGAKTVALTSLGDRHYRLRQTLWVEIDASGEAVTAHVSDLEEYGMGATEYEALDDLRATLVDTYFFLLANETRLGPAPTSQLERFRELVEKV